MQYLGGKARTAGPIAAYLTRLSRGRCIVEPFCGALNITARLEGPRVAADASESLITLFQSWREGWRPPVTLNQEEYNVLAATRDSRNPLTAFAGYGCSFGGKFFAGLCHPSADAPSRDYVGAAARQLAKKMARCAQVTFQHRDYRCTPSNPETLLYCDPPYANTTSYAATGRFNTADFWEWVRYQERAGVTVVISEYSAPEDFTCVLEIPTRHDMQGHGKGGVMERLFRWNPQGDLIGSGESVE